MITAIKLLRRIKHFFLPGRGSGSVRFMFPLVLGFSALLGASALNSVSYSYIRIDPSVESLKSGERFSINVFAYAHQPVNAVDISVSFSKEVVDILGVATGQSVITLWTEEPYVKDNRVFMTGGTFKKGFVGEHLIATINAKAKKTGEVDFVVDNISLLAGDGKGTPVLTGRPDSSRASIYVYDQDGKPGNIKADVTVHLVTDINGDGKVTINDIGAFLSAWNSRSAVYDFNSDGKMTFRDFAIILADSFFGPKTE